MNGSGAKDRKQSEKFLEPCPPSSHSGVRVNCSYVNGVFKRDAPLFRKLEGSEIRFTYDGGLS